MNTHPQECRVRTPSWETALLVLFFSTWTQRESAFLCLLLCFNKRIAVLLWDT